ncbi:MAG: Ppx/GppA family phosphatase [Alphaproteobacteria bacterium]|nr:Ppx/GppA family phosphatase [Alphaproteobacteria bacterium]
MNDRSPWGRRHQYESGAGEVYAAVDLGTNNCRLLVARPALDGFRVIDSFSRIVRLGEGLGLSGELGDAAIDRSIAALRVCAGKIRRRRATRTRCVATEACRLAANCNSFLDRVIAETGLDIEIISASEEAWLAASGCAPLLDRVHDRAIVFDIGGGSTEVLWLAVPAVGEPEVIDCLSIPAGVVGLSERFGGHSVGEDDYAAILREVRLALVAFEERNAIRHAVGLGRVQMLGSSGTVTTLTGIHLDLPRYRRDQVDGRQLTFAEIVAVIGRLRAMDEEGRAAQPCIGRERADLVIPGCAILEVICGLWPVGVVRVADRGVREGILLGLINGDRPAPGGL